MSCPTQKEGRTQALPRSQELQKCPRPQNSSRFCRHSHSHATNTQVPEVSRCPWTPTAPASLGAQGGTVVWL